MDKTVVKKMCSPGSDAHLHGLVCAVLGKAIGVYLGRPVEHWPAERIASNHGVINHYLLAPDQDPVVTDDDIAGTFLFPRAVLRAPPGRDPTAADIGRHWLNELIEGRSTLWWGGLGNSTEHTAYLRLAAGLSAPESGSARRNGRIVSEQIGGQIFADGWGLLCPSDPGRAARLARAAASVSHDGLAVDAAGVVAAMAACAFEQQSPHDLVARACAQLPAQNRLRNVAAALQAWCADTDLDWRGVCHRIEQTYGEAAGYGGNCHVVTNFAIVLMAILCSEGELDLGLERVVGAGRDTDSNAGNVGLILAIRAGHARLAAYGHWLDPLSDRLLLSSADGAVSIADAVGIARECLRLSQHLYGLPGSLQTGHADDPASESNHARFIFDIDRSSQGFGSHHCDDPLHRGATPRCDGRKGLLIHLTAGAKVATSRAIFAEPAQRGMPIYDLVVTPVLHAGQWLWANVSADYAGSHGQLAVWVRGKHDALLPMTSDPIALSTRACMVQWQLPASISGVIERVGILLTARQSTRVHLHTLGWQGAPHMRYQPDQDMPAQSFSWIVDCDQHWAHSRHGCQRLSHAGNRGLVQYGPRDWTDLEMRARLRWQLLAEAGLIVRARGLRNYVMLVWKQGQLRLVECIDETEVQLAACQWHWADGTIAEWRVQMRGQGITVRIDPDIVMVGQCSAAAKHGNIGFMCTQGTLDILDWSAGPVRSV